MGPTLRIFTEPQQGASYDQLRAVATTAEQQGFDAFFRSDHFLSMGGTTGLPGPSDAWTTLGGLARDTTTIRLGTLVTAATFRHPGLLAIQVANVDAMSGGRIELGLGTGWYEEEHQAYGVPFPPLKERFERLDEQLQVIRGLWTTPDDATFDFEGRHYSLAGAPALPKPTQRPHPPIVVGGGGHTKTPRLAARYADEYNLGFRSAEAAQPAFARVRQACEQHGRDPVELVYSVAIVVCCGTNNDELTTRAARIGRPLDDLRANGAAGTPQEVLDKLATYAAAGAQRIYLQVLDLDDLDHIRLLGQEVLPRV